MKNDDHIVVDDNKDTVDNICEECRKEHESVKQNLIMHSYKICNSCNLSKRIFPLQKPLNKTIIKNKKNACTSQETITTPNAFQRLS